MVSKCFPRKGCLLTPLMADKKTQAERGNTVRLRAHMCSRAQLGESAGQVLVLRGLFPSTGATFSTNFSVPRHCPVSLLLTGCCCTGVLSHQLTYCFKQVYRLSVLFLLLLLFFFFYTHLTSAAYAKKESKRNAELNRQVCFLLLTAQEGILKHPRG